MTSSIFRSIYRTNAWNGVESLSGPGSGDAATERIAVHIAQLVDDLGVRSVLDAACGDGYWMPDLPGYIGIDIAPEAIRRAQSRHPDRQYHVGNVAKMRLPACDLIICRDAIQHLSLRDGMAVVSKLVDSGARWMLASTYVESVNDDVPTGFFYSPNLEAEPFGLPAPERLIFDGYDYAEPRLVRDPAKHLGLWRL